MNARPIAPQLVVAVLLLLSLLSSPAAAIEPEKQPIYSNTPGAILCGTQSTTQCTVPVGQRLIIDHVSGYSFQNASAKTTLAVQLVIMAPALGLNGAAFHTFVATKTNTSNKITDVFSFSTPFRMMLPPGATFYFSPVVNVAVSGYLVSE